MCPRLQTRLGAGDGAGRAACCVARARSCFAARAQAARVGHRGVAGARRGFVPLGAAQRAGVGHRAGIVRRQLRAGARGAARLAGKGGAQPGAAVERSKRRRSAHQPRVSARLGARHALRAAHAMPRQHTCGADARRAQRRVAPLPRRLRRRPPAAPPAAAARWRLGRRRPRSSGASGSHTRSRAPAGPRASSAPVRSGGASRWRAPARRGRGRASSARRAPCSSGWCGTCRGSSQTRRARCQHPRAPPQGVRPSTRRRPPQRCSGSTRRRTRTRRSTWRPGAARGPRGESARAADARRGALSLARLVAGGARLQRRGAAALAVGAGPLAGAAGVVGHEAAPLRRVFAPSRRQG